MEKISLSITVSGLVQGVGFRPFIYRKAVQSGLTGWVQNTNANVRIEVTGSREKLDNFISSIERDVPSAAAIEKIIYSEIKLVAYTSFSIRESNNVSDDVTEISPDIAVCSDCLEDMKQQPHREAYAFINCTNCGPRFTIIENLPYDRSETTMKSFEMCPVCRKEYDNVTDRRFHAQPIACNNCGPEYEIITRNGSSSKDIFSIIRQVADIIGSGGVVLIKGLGGMHLACDAFNDAAINKLRLAKKRDGKPFAVMFRNIDLLRMYTEIDSASEQSLISWKRPIVLLEKKETSPLPPLSHILNSGLNLIGAMLPYMPFHHLLMESLCTPAIVLTSGNFHNEPIIIDNELARKQFLSSTDALVLHNREIYNRTDDSVTRILAGKERIFRRSRGYVPAPVITGLNTEGILAFGAELTNCFCAGKGNKAYLSQHIGDLQGFGTTEFYEETISRFIKLFRIKPSLVAVDMHPDYISSKSGFSYNSLPVVMVQHHHAHIASCMAEHALDEKVIGVAFDGTGFGTDGNIWGSEFLVCDMIDFERITHFDYIPLPGGDTAIEEPWRIAVSWLYKVFGKSFTSFNLPLLKVAGKERYEIIIRMIDKKINSPLTSGAGRLFDAVASLTDIVHFSSFQSEGPMRLESLVRSGIKGSYPYSSRQTICLDELIKAIVDDVLKGEEKVTIATKLHNTIILIIFDIVSAIRKDKGINKVVLSGGVFQNKYLLEGITDLLTKNDFELYSNRSVPANDGGIALGQLAVASKRREMKCV